MFKMRSQISGARNGVDWPRPGKPVPSDLTEDEKETLVSHGHIFEEDEGAAVVELADGTTVGDGVTVATLPTADVETAVAPTKPRGRRKPAPEPTES